MQARTRRYLFAFREHNGGLFTETPGNVATLLLVSVISNTHSSFGYFSLDEYSYSLF
jgi:hypothetical protein